MSFPRYPSYKDSGVEWLGEVPGHWGFGSVRWLTRRYSGGTPDKTNLAFWEDGTIPWLNSGAVNDRLITEPSTYITTEAFANSSAKWIPDGALVMALAGQGKTKGMVAQLAIPSTCNQSMAAIIPGPEIAARFLFWWLESNYQNIRNMAGGDLRDGLNLELLGNIPCPLAPTSEQTQIAAFLDRETAKIDELVAEQQRLMELLKEKRQAVISHTVTQGLNTNAPMKPSGIEWLGDVPAHWDVMSLRRCLIEHRQGYYSEVPYVDAGIKLLRITDLRDFGKVDFTQCPQVESLDELEPFLLKSSDFVFARTGGAGTFGLVETVNEPAAYASYLIRFRFSDSTHANFLRYFFLSSMFEVAVRQNIHGGVNKNIHAEDIKNQFIALPPISEQIGISEWLDLETKQFDTLTAEAQRAIDLLQERRTALISAAVTGKVDVRKFA